MDRWNLGRREPDPKSHDHVVAGVTTYVLSVLTSVSIVIFLLEMRGVL
jgi:hypothetical protein